MIRIPQIETFQRPIREKLGQYFSPKYGKGVFFAGGKGRGKTHEIVNYIWHLTQDLNWYVFTNIQFRYTGPGDPDREMPEKVHFVKYMSNLWKEFADVREEHGKVPVVIILDEFHQTVNRLESHKYYNIVTGLMSWLSQCRKFKQSNLFCSQYLIQIPKDPRVYADHFIVKNRKVAKQLSLNGDSSMGTRYFSQVITPEDGEVKTLDKHGNIKWRSNKKFRKRHISDDLQDLIKHDIIEDILGSVSCPLNDPNRGNWQFLSEKVSTFVFDQINGDDCTWFDSMFEELGESERKGLEVYEAIREFFDDYEQEDEGIQLTPFNELSDSRKALLTYEISQLSDRRSLSKVDAAAIFGLDRTAINKARDNWDDYFIDQHIDNILTEDDNIQIENREGVRGAPV